MLSKVNTAFLKIDRNFESKMKSFFLLSEKSNLSPINLLDSYALYALFPDLRML